MMMRLFQRRKSGGGSRVLDWLRLLCGVDEGNRDGEGRETFLSIGCGLRVGADGRLDSF